MVTNVHVEVVMCMFTISSTLYLVVFLSNSITMWVFDFESTSCRTFVCRKREGSL